MAEKLPESTQFDGAEIWIDEFSGFTPQEYSVIEELLKKSKRVNVCLCTDYLFDEIPFSSGDVFYSGTKYSLKLRELAQKIKLLLRRP